MADRVEAFGYQLKSRILDYRRLPLGTPGRTLNPANQRRHAELGGDG
ncbi:MAG TPA: hypothetical protein VMO17_08920 [Terriglobia bacterium]|nr:hypothetical protein [Terriglobia bacterium]